MKFNFCDKKSLSLVSNMIVVAVLGVLILIVTATGVGDATFNNFQVLQVNQDEQQCRGFGYKGYDRDVYCDNTKNIDEVDEDLRYLLCDIGSEDYILYEETRQYTEDEQDCTKEGDEACTCVMNAFFYQQSETMRLLEQEENGDVGLGVTIGENTGQERSWLETVERLFTREGYQSTIEDGIDPSEYNYAAIYEPIDEFHPILEPKVGSEFINRVNLIANQLETDPRFLISVMSFETGDTFDPCARNSRSTATGLIQFIETTANNLEEGLHARLCTMSAVEQLEYVQKYYESCGDCQGNLDSIEKAYTAVFSGRVREGNEVIYSSPSNEYNANRELDTRLGNGDGRITVSEVAFPVKTKYRQYFGEIINRRLRESGTFAEPNTDLLAQYTGSNNVPHSINSDSPIWQSGQLHSSIINRKDFILGFRGDEHEARDHTIYSNVLIATSEAAKYAESIGCDFIVTSGNRWGISDTHNHAQNGRTGNAIDFVLEKNGNRCSAQEYAQVIYQAYKNGATEFGFGVSNGAGSHIGVSIAGGIRTNANAFENSIPQWNYDSSGQAARDIFNSIVRDNRETSTS